MNLVKERLLGRSDRGGPPRDQGTVGASPATVVRCISRL